MKKPIKKKKPAQESSGDKGFDAAMDKLLKPKPPKK